MVTSTDLIKLYASRHKQEREEAHAVAAPSATPPVKRKRGRPRVDKTSPDSNTTPTLRQASGEKRKRGRPRKAKKEHRRRTTADSAASSSAGESTPRVKRKYTKRTPTTKKEALPNSADRVKGKRGRPRKIDQLAQRHPEEVGRIRVRSNLMPANTEPIPVDSDDEPDLGSPKAAGGVVQSKMRTPRWRSLRTAPIRPRTVARAPVSTCLYMLAPHSSSDSSDSENEPETTNKNVNPGSASDSDPERNGIPGPVPTQDEISESDNESADKSFQCHICKKWYSTRNKGSGGGRSRARSSDKYECDCCNQTFTRREKLWEHKAEVHRGSMTVRCECGAQFPRHDQLARHVAAAHPAPARLPHACPTCGKRHLANYKRLKQ
ncbi:unnamed protein product [Leptidea sinapis]|uniref:C2H2-type domain-containing protein n=1 Tax=Leptidea sinapis TaxID=189913 RepID=A0A5E4PRM9_9NEOP|nr:unnamed protein product [Leptidea sinapis]